MKKILIATYSWSGTTKKVADQIAAMLPTAERYEIMVPDGTYDVSDMFGTADKAKKQLANNDLPALVKPLPDLSSFDLILVGSPDWSGMPATPVKTFLNKLEDYNGKVATFYTDAGSVGDFEAVFSQWVGSKATVLPAHRGTNGLDQWINSMIRN